MRDGGVRGAWSRLRVGFSVSCVYCLVCGARGLKVLEGELQGLPPSSVVNADIAFKLYDTYGFPLDLTQVWPAHGSTTRGVAAPTHGHSCNAYIAAPLRSWRESVRWTLTLLAPRSCWKRRGSEHARRGPDPVVYRHPLASCESIAPMTARGVAHTACVGHH